MKIPKRFKLMGQTIEVVLDESIMHDSDARGLAIYRDNVIKLMPPTKSVPLPVEQYEQAFCHELIHWLLFFGGSSLHYDEDRPLHSHEEFVDTLGHLLHQYMTTVEYR